VKTRAKGLRISYDFLKTGEKREKVTGKASKTEVFLTAKEKFKKDAKIGGKYQGVCYNRSSIYRKG